MKVALTFVVGFLGFLVVMNLASAADRKQARFMNQCRAQMAAKYGYPDRYANARYIDACFAQSLEH